MRTFKVRPCDEKPLEETLNLCGAMQEPYIETLFTVLSGPQKMDIEDFL